MKFKITSKKKHPWTEHVDSTNVNLYITYCYKWPNTIAKSFVTKYLHKAYYTVYHEGFDVTWSTTTATTATTGQKKRQSKQDH